MSLRWFKGQAPEIDNTKHGLVVHGENHFFPKEKAIISMSIDLKGTYCATQVCTIKKK